MTIAAQCSSAVKVAVNRMGLVIDNTPIYLRSGELVHFRLPPKTWRDRLMKLKDCGGNAVSFYIPGVLPASDISRRY